MPLADAQALRFPSAVELARYGRDTSQALVAKIEAMDDEFLLGTTSTRVEGEILARIHRRSGLRGL